MILRGEASLHKQGNARRVTAQSNHFKNKCAKVTFYLFFQESVESNRSNMAHHNLLGLFTHYCKIPGAVLVGFPQECRVQIY